MGLNGLSGPGLKDLGTYKGRVLKNLDASIGTSRSPKEPD